MRCFVEAAAPPTPRLTMNASVALLLCLWSARALPLESTKPTVRLPPDGHWNALVPSVRCLPLFVRSLIVPFVTADVDGHLTEIVRVRPRSRNFVFASFAPGNFPVLIAMLTGVPAAAISPGAVP